MLQGNNWLKIVVVTFATLYSYAWDIYMDWGLLRDDRWLRPKILFPQNWYYAAAFLNLVLRFIWILTLFPETFFSGFFTDVEGILLILAVAEVY